MAFRSPDIAEILRHPATFRGGMLERNKGSVYRHVYPANGRITCEMTLALVSTFAGGPDIGEELVRHPGIDKVQFVGSDATAKKILRTAAETLKPCGLQLGGKSAVIVFADADVQEAWAPTSILRICVARTQSPIRSKPDWSRSMRRVKVCSRSRRSVV